MFIDPDFSQVLIRAKGKSLEISLQGFRDGHGKSGIMAGMVGTFVMLISVLKCPKGQAGAPWNRGRCPCPWQWVSFKVLSIPFWGSGICAPREDTKINPGVREQSGNEHIQHRRLVGHKHPKGDNGRQLSPKGTICIENSRKQIQN